MAGLRNGFLLAAVGLALTAPAAHAVPPAFTAGPQISTGWGPVATVGDLNGDGRDDIVVASGTDEPTATVLLAQPSGGHAPAGTYSVSRQPQRLHLADLDGNGRLDIVVEALSEFTVLHGGVDGGYTEELRRQKWGDIGIADLDGNGRPEIAHVRLLESTLHVGSAEPGGGYTWRTYPTRSTPKTVQIFDFTADGRLDALTLHESGDRSSLFAGGPGGPAEAVAYGSSGYADGVPLELDLDRDGDRDHVSLDAVRSRVVVRRLNGGDYDYETHWLDGAALQPPVANDFDGDGLIDLAALTAPSTDAVRLTILPGAPGGRFDAPVQRSLGDSAGSVFATGDFDHDGRPDLLVRDLETYSLRIWHNRTPRLALGDPTLWTGRELHVPYTLDAFRSDVAELRVEVKRPQAAGFEFHASLDDPQSPGIISVVDDALVDGGEWRLRVTAYGHDGRTLETSEAVEDVEGYTAVGLDPPFFGELPVGGAGLVTRVRVENIWKAKLRVRRIAITKRADEYRIVREDCTGRAVVSGDSCHVDIAFTPTGLGRRQGWIELEGNAASIGTQLDGFGIAAPPPAEPEPEIVALPSPTPQATPAPPTRAEEPKLVFKAAAGRASTRLSGLRLERLASGTTVAVRCWSGCSRITLTKNNVKGTLSLASFAKRRLKAGTTIRITIARPGADTLVTTLKIRARRKPSLTTRSVSL